MMPPHWDPGAREEGSSKHQLPSRDLWFFNHLGNFSFQPEKNPVLKQSSFSKPYTSAQKPSASASPSTTGLQKPCARPSLLGPLPALLRTTEFAPKNDRAGGNRRTSALPLSAAFSRGLKVLTSSGRKRGSEQEQAPSTKASSSEELGAGANVPPANTPERDSTDYTIQSPVKGGRARAAAWGCKVLYVAFLLLSVVFLYVENTACRRAFAEGRVFECLLWISFHLLALTFYLWAGFDPGYIRKPSERSEFGRSPVPAPPVRMHPQNLQRHYGLKLPGPMTESAPRQQPQPDYHSDTPTPKVTSGPALVQTGGKMVGAARAASGAFRELAFNASAVSLENQGSVYNPAFQTQSTPKSPPPESSLSNEQTAVSGMILRQAPPNQHRVCTGSPAVTKCFNEKLSYRNERLPFCDHCQLTQPLRARHCKACDHCVLTFDHHCTFLGTRKALRRLLRCDRTAGLLYRGAARSRRSCLCCNRSTAGVMTHSLRPPCGLDGG